jgi:uracil-DNA glycosylase family 4
VIIPPPSDFLTGYHFSPKVVTPSGSGSSGIMLIGEAPGKHEDDDNLVFHPKADAGSVLARALRRANISRDGLTLTNTVWQRPPGNELEGQLYEPEARAYWKPYNEALIAERRPKVIILLGNSALKAFTEFGYDDKTTITHMMGYSLPQPDGTILIPSIHPSFILHGQQAFNQVLIWTLQRAMQLTQRPLVALPTNYVTHPKLEDMLAFKHNFDPARHTLAFDIETPESDKLDEEEVEDKEEDISYNIVRASLCYDGDLGYAISFPWQEPFIELAKQMLGMARKLEVWNRYFDVPRLLHAGVKFSGRIIDRMQSWRFLQPTLPASLEFATPLLGWTNAPWKYVSQKEPEFYSAVDAHALRRNGMAIEAALAARGVTELHDRHVVECYEVLERMAQNGLPYDAPAAQEFKVRLEKMKVEREAELQQRVPDSLKPVKQKKGYKKIPKNCEGLVRRKFRLKFSELTGVERDLLNQHKLFELPSTAGPFTDDEIVEVERWAKLEPFLATSTQQMQALVKWAGFKPGTNRKTKKATMDDETKRKLIAKCINSTRKKDQEFAETLKLCREVSQLSKVIGTYVKGWRPGADGRIHAIPGFWGKMFRISWRRPNLAATIQDKTEDYIAAGFRKCVSVPSDRMLVEADWKGIEAVIVGYLAGDPDYIRLAKIGIHDYFCAHILASKGKIKTSDIPSLTLSDGELKKVFKWIKHDFPKDRDDAKHIIHGTAYGMTPPLMSSLYELPIAEAEHLQGFYFEIYPKIKIWQESVKEKAHRDIWLQNLFGYRMAFFEIYRWNSQRYERLLATWRKLDGFAPNGMRWTLTTIEQGWITAIRAGMAKGLSTEDAISKLCYDLGDDAKSAISFLPRDTAAAMLKEALLRLRPLAFSHYDVGFAIGCAHDAILVECPKSRTDEVARLLHSEMERPVPQLNNLVVNVELKAGQSWDSDGMEVIEVPTIEQIPAILSS